MIMLLLLMVMMIMLVYITQINDTPTNQSWTKLTEFYYKYTHVWSCNHNYVRMLRLGQRYAVVVDG